MRSWKMVCCLLALAGCAQAQSVEIQAQQLERDGEVLQAHALLARAALASPGDAAAWQAYAQFLDRYHDPARREAYEKWLDALRNAGPQERAAVARRLAILDLIAGDQAAARQHLTLYKEAGGPLSAQTEQVLGAGPNPALPLSAGPAEIPGPLRSLQRMAAISSDVGPEEFLPALARNIVTSGYQSGQNTEGLEPTEYLKLVNRYLSQARELTQMAGAKHAIDISSCDSAETAELLRILGYRLRGGCGPDAVLETVNASRAFLTTDSGFPLAELEEALRKNQPFHYAYNSTTVQVMFGPAYWVSGEKDKGPEDFVEALIGDPALARLYLAFSKLDPQTATEFRGAYPLERWRAYAHVVDYYGSRFEIRDGKAVVPGGERSAAAWAELTGASPNKPAQFFEHLVSRDDGWMASYFDALSRTTGPALAYFTEPTRMKRFYQAVRGRVTSPGPARPVFRANADMMLLTTRLQIGPDGSAHIPGGIDPWKQLFAAHPRGKYDNKLTRAASGWKASDDVVEALFALCRKQIDNEPMRIFLTISDIDRNRKSPMQPATVARLISDYHNYGPQYPLITDAPGLSEETIIATLDTMDAVSRIKDTAQRMDTVGTFQALLSLWQILTREGQVPQDRADASLKSLDGLFAAVKNNRELFDAGRAGVRILLTEAGSPEAGSPQDRMMELLAGSASPAGPELHQQAIASMTALFDLQRLVSLKTLFDLADHLESVSRGEKLNVGMTTRLAARIAEIRLPRTTLTTVEKNSFSFGYWTEKHIEDQRTLNLRQAVEKAAGQPEKLKDTRGLLAPFLRDTLVGFSYIYYAPPGGQIIRTNPLFVRSHDFVGSITAPHTWRRTDLFGLGWPSNGGGRLLGSLSGLPYAMAQAEENFLVPTQRQALIWGDLAPQILIGAIVPRWWRVTPVEQHWLALHLRLGEELLAEGALDSKEREELLAALSRLVAPARRYQIAEALASGRAKDAIEQTTPEEHYLLARQYLETGGPQAMEAMEQRSPVYREIRRLSAEQPASANHARVAAIFGSPHPLLASSFRPELLSLPTFPTLMGYSSRVMAETWESNNLYWAALADELHIPPARLNLMIPEWTRSVIERIFATHLEDWPAVLRSLRAIGEEYRQQTRPQLLNDLKASLN